VPNSIALLPHPKDGGTTMTANAPELDRLVKTVTDAVMEAMAAS
jgi:hypothetical protein